MRRSRRVSRLLVPVAAAWLLAVGAPASGSSSAPGDDTVVAIGDIHGAYDEIVELLRAVDLIDELDNWVGGERTLVQNGDMLDRGADARRVLDLMIRLQGEAEAAGGRVVVLLGNHEVMNLVGALQDVTPEIMASFADRESESRQRAAFREYEQQVLRRDRGYRSADARTRRRIQLAWEDDHPIGMVEMIRALGPSGSYGRWLRSLPVTFENDGVLFMHAGISETYADVPLQEIDARVHAEIDTLDRYRAHLMELGELTATADLPELVAAAAGVVEGLAGRSYKPERAGAAPALPAPDVSLGSPSAWTALAGLDHWYLFAAEGPLWFRGYARWSYEAVRERTPPILARVGVETAVVGHTPQLEGIRVRAEGALYLIDTGMLTSVYGGQGEALVLEGGTAKAVRSSGGERRLPAPAARTPVEVSR